MRRCCSRPSALLAVTALILPRLGTELIPAALAGRVHGEDAPARGLAARRPPTRRCRSSTRRRATCPTLDSAYAVAGTGNRLDANPVDSGENTGNLDVKLRAPDRQGRRRTRRCRTCARGSPTFPGAQYEFTRPSLLTLATPVEVILAGYDLERLDVAAGAVRTRMEASGAFKDIRSSIEGGHPEIQILFDQERASQLGLAVRDIADRVVSNVRGDVATRYRLQEKKIDVLVRSVDTRAASIERSTQPRREPGLRAAGAALGGRRGAPRHRSRRNPPRQPGTCGGDFGRARARRPRRRHGHGAGDPRVKLPCPSGSMGSVSGQSEEMTQSFRSLGLAFALAVFLVYLVMASQFESLLHPVRHPVHDSHGPHRLGVGPVHHRHHHQLRGAHRPHHAGGHRGEQRHRAHRRHQPGARTRPREDRGHQACRQHAPAAHPHHQREHHHRPHSDGHRHRRRRRDPPAHGHHRDRRQPGRDVPHAHRDPGAVRGARSQGIREDRPRRRPCQAASHPGHAAAGAAPAED